MFINELVDKI